MRKRMRKTVSMLLLLIMGCSVVFNGAPLSVAVAGESLLEAGQTLEDGIFPDDRQTSDDGAFPDGGTDILDSEDGFAPCIISSGLGIEEEVEDAIAQAYSAIVEPLAGGYGTDGKFLAPIEAPDPDAIKIYTAQDLDNVRNNLSGSYVLMNDIDLSGFNGGGWVPIGDNSTNSYDSRFSGTFDGQGYIIRNLTITGQYQYAGLFGYAPDITGTTIKNVGLEDININITNNSDVHSYVGGISGYNRATISNCYTTGSLSVSSTINYSYPYVGGICCGGGTITYCYNTGSIIASSSSPSQSCAGGICAESGNISDCYNTGSVAAEYCAGGICGDGSDSISNCYNAGSVAAESNAGGICGDGSGMISNCYNIGFVSGSSVSGGVCGKKTDRSNINGCYNTGSISVADPLTSSFAGGICGFGGYDISDCYNTGSVFITSHAASFQSFAGGICGAGNYGNSISDCYNIGSVFVFSASSDSRAGGICGTSSNITDCYNAGSIAASSGAVYTLVGGICGNISDTGISNCFNIGSVSASAATSNYYYVGGICGYNGGSGNISNCYWKIESNQIANDVLRLDEEKRLAGNKEDSTTGRLTSAEMKDKASFTGFDFETIWDISPTVNDGYPFLKYIPVEISEHEDAEAPIITILLPHDQTVILGDVATLSITAGVPQGILTYQWYQSATDTNTEGMPISGATNSMYNVPTDSVSIFYYYCVVTNTDDSATVNKTASVASNTVKVTVTDTPVTTILPGDVSGDGAVNMTDVLMIYQHFRGMIILDEDQLQTADVNGDGLVNMQDVLLVYQYFRGKITEFHPYY